MPQAPEIHGHVAPAFEAVADTFRQNFERWPEVGASVCAWHKGEVVVDLWGGIADSTTGREWEADTLGVVFSVTKGVVALCFLMLADRGQLDYDLPIAHYWNEFGQAGKEDITVRQLLNHRSGLCAIDQPLSILDLADDAKVEAALVAQEPLWPPGQGQGYHAISYGPYAAALFRKVAGKSLGTFIREEIAGPLGADVYLGLPETLNHRVARVEPPALKQKLTEVVPALFGQRNEGRLYRAALRQGSDTKRSFANPGELGARNLANFNRKDVWALELPWANCIASARGLASVYAGLAGNGTHNGVELVRPQTLEQVLKRQTYEVDRVLRKRLGWSQGFIKEEPHLFSPNESAIGHPGAGGALGLADPNTGLSIGYVMNRMDTRLRSPRAIALCHSIYACLDKG